MQKRSINEILRKIEKKIRVRTTKGLIIKHLDELDIIPLLRCNLNCAMCHQAEIKDKKDMTLENFVKMVKQLKKARITKVSLVGGEILVMKDIWQFIEILEKNKINYDFASNITMLTDEDIKKLKKLEYLEKITTSLDGTEEIHNRIRRNSTAYQRTTRNIKKLLKECFRVNVGLVVQKTNLKKLIEIFNHICDLGVNDITFLIELRTTPKEKEVSKKIIKRITNKNPEIFMSALKNPLGELKEKEYPMINEKIEKLNKIAKKRGVTLGLPIQLTNTEVLYDKTVLKDYTCEIFKGYNFQACNDYTLSFCPFISLGKGFKILTQNPLKIANSLEYIKLRKFFKDHGALPVCRRCCGLVKKKC